MGISLIIIFLIKEEAKKCIVKDQKEYLSATVHFMVRMMIWMMITLRDKTGKIIKI